MFRESIVLLLCFFSYSFLSSNEKMTNSTAFLLISASQQRMRKPISKSLCRRSPNTAWQREGCGTSDTANVGTLPTAPLPLRCAIHRSVHRIPTHSHEVCILRIRKHSSSPRLLRHCLTFATLSLGSNGPSRRRQQRSTHVVASRCWVVLLPTNVHDRSTAVQQ